MPDAASAAGHRLRLRRRFLQNGLGSLYDHEVLELLLTYAIPRRDVKPLAKTLIQRFGSLARVFDATEYELESVPGVGEHAAGLILLMIYWGTIGVVGPAVLFLILLTEIIVMTATRTNSLIHDLLAGTVCIDAASQRIFDTPEERIAYKAKIAAELAQKEPY